MDSSISESNSATELSFLRMLLAGAAVFSLVYHPSNIESKLESRVKLRLRCSVDRILSKASDADATPKELRFMKYASSLAFERLE